MIGGINNHAFFSMVDHASLTIHSLGYERGTAFHVTLYLTA
jgi:hypothetical protein